MKSNTSSPKLPAGKAQWKKVIALAPGKDRPPITAENTARKNAVCVAGGGYAAVRDALVKNTPRPAWATAKANQAGRHGALQR